MLDPEHKILPDTDKLPKDDEEMMWFLMSDKVID